MHKRYMDDIHDAAAAFKNGAPPIATETVPIMDVYVPSWLHAEPRAVEALQGVQIEVGETDSSALPVCRDRRGRLWAAAHAAVVIALRRQAQSGPVAVPVAVVWTEPD